MGQIGGVKPGYHEGYKAHIWNVPVTIYNEDEDRVYQITGIIEDEGFLVINVKSVEK